MMVLSEGTNKTQTATPSCSVHHCIHEYAAANSYGVVQVQALRSVEKYLQLEKLYVLGTNYVDNGPPEGLGKFLKAASSSPETVLHYEFMQVCTCVNSCLLIRSHQRLVQLVYFHSAIVHCKLLSLNVMSLTSKASVHC